MSDSDTGRFVWYELMTTDPAAAIAFYTEVTGWKTERWDEGDYIMWVGEQGPLGGVTILPELARQLGAPPHWQGYVQVADVDATAARVRELGGRVLHAEEAPTVGRFAIVADPQGAVIAAFTPARAMAAHDPARPGEFSWHELYTTDHQAALGFYQQIAGWERLDAVDMGPMGTYQLYGRGGTPLGGMMNLPPGVRAPDGGAPRPGWMFYVTTADLDAALARATAAGGRVVNGPMDVPGGQRIAQLLDPQGAAFALVTPPAGAPT